MAAVLTLTEGDRRSRGRNRAVGRAELTDEQVFAFLRRLTELCRETGVTLECVPDPAQLELLNDRIRETVIYGDHEGVGQYEVDEEEAYSLVSLVPVPLARHSLHRGPRSCWHENADESVIWG